MSSLGDILHVLPAVGALRKNWPEAKITWAVHPQYANLLPRAPYVDEIIKIPRKGLFSLQGMQAVRKLLQGRQFDMVIDFQGLLKTIPLHIFSGCSERYGYSDVKEGSQFFCKVLRGPHSKGHVIERYLDVVRLLGGDTASIEVPPIHLDRGGAEALLQKLDISSPYAVFVLGTQWVNKEWPPAYYAQLANHMAKDGYQIVLTGTQEDIPKAEAMMQDVKDAKVLNVMGKTSLKELFLLIERADFFISGDTGPMHYASMMKRPMIALFGATYPNRTGPYGNPKGCYLISETAPKNHDHLSNNNSSVMQGISPQAVIRMYEDMKREGVFSSESES